MCVCLRVWLFVGLWVCWCARRVDCSVGLRDCLCALCGWLLCLFVLSWLIVCLGVVCVCLCCVCLCC